MSGTATAGEDFEAVSGRIEFEKGQTMRAIRVPIKDDDEVEGNEQFTVVLSKPSKGCRIGPAAECEVIIMDGSNVSTIANPDLVPGPGVLA